MELHDEMGNQLASITALINLINIRQSKKENHIEDLLAKLNQRSQVFFYGAKDFIWSINPKSDKTDAVLINIKDFGEELFEGTGISYHFYSENKDESITFAAGISRHVTLICKEIFTNIVKHARCQQVQVKVWQEAQNLVNFITDDGVVLTAITLKKPGFA